MSHNVIKPEPPNDRDVGDQSVVTSSQPNRFIWFFRTREEDGSIDNLCCEYHTESMHVASVTAEREYGTHVLAARRRELTFEEYCGLLMCNREGSDHLKRVYKAMQDLFFRCNPRSS